MALRGDICLLHKLLLALMLLKDARVSRKKQHIGFAKHFVTNHHFELSR